MLLLHVHISTMGRCVMVASNLELDHLTLAFLVTAQFEMFAAFQC